MTRRWEDQGGNVQFLLVPMQVFVNTSLLLIVWRWTRGIMPVYVLWIREPIWRPILTRFFSDLEVARTRVPWLLGTSDILKFLLVKKPINLKPSFYDLTGMPVIIRLSSFIACPRSRVHCHRINFMAFFPIKNESFCWALCKHWSCAGDNSCPDLIFRNLLQENKANLGRFHAPCTC